MFTSQTVPAVNIGPEAEKHVAAAKSPAEAVALWWQYVLTRSDKKFPRFRFSRRWWLKCLLKGRKLTPYKQFPVEMAKLVQRELPGWGSIGLDVSMHYDEDTDEPRPSTVLRRTLHASGFRSFLGFDYYEVKLPFPELKVTVWEDHIEVQPEREGAFTIWAKQS